MFLIHNYLVNHLGSHLLNYYTASHDTDYQIYELFI